MLTNWELKCHTRESLRGQRLRLAGMFAVLMAAYILTEFVSAVFFYLLGLKGTVDVTLTPDIYLDNRLQSTPLTLFLLLGTSLLMLLVLPQLCAGFARACGRAAQGKELRSSSMFRFFVSPVLYVKSMCFTCNKTVRCIFLLLLPLLPAAVLWGVRLYLSDRDASAQTLSLLLLLQFLLTLLGLFVGTVLRLYYYLADYFFLMPAEHPVWKSFGRSRRMMRRYIGRTFRFVWSFALWWVLCLLIFPLFYVVPYYTAAKMEFCRALTQEELLEERVDS